MRGIGQQAGFRRIGRQRSDFGETQLRFGDWTSHRVKSVLREDCAGVRVASVAHRIDVNTGSGGGFLGQLGVQLRQSVGKRVLTDLSALCTLLQLGKEGLPLGGCHALEEFLGPTKP